MWFGGGELMETSSRAEKEAFVSGHSGTTLSEVYLVLITCCFGVLLRHVGLLCQHTIRTRHRQSLMYGCVHDLVYEIACFKTKTAADPEFVT